MLFRSQEVVAYLNKECGFLGLTGYSDNREVVDLAKQGDKKAQLAVDIFAYRIQKYIGAYFVALQGLDCIVFTGGIGENSKFSRKVIMEGLEPLGIEFDYEKNESAQSGSLIDLTGPKSKIKVLVIPTNEELVIARDAKHIALQKN